MTKRAPIDVFAYRDYREFLRAYSERRSIEKRGFSQAEFARSVGLKTPNYLKLVITGERNLTPALARRFGEACNLSGDALDYFLALVHYGQAKGAVARERAYAQLQAFKRFRTTYRLDGAQSDYYGQWYIPAVHELCLRADFDEDPKWIAKALLPAITPKQAAQAWQVLQKLELVKRDGAGRWKQTTAAVGTSKGPLGHQVARFHRNMMERAAESIDLVSKQERELGALTLCVSEQHLQELKADVEELRKKLLAKYINSETPERVVQVNFQMFPLSKKLGSE